MTRRLPCPPAPGPLEAYAARFDDLLSTLAQRRGFREYLAGLLLLRDRNKTLTCLAGTEPVVGAQQPSVQRLPLGHLVRPTTRDFARNSTTRAARGTMKFPRDHGHIVAGGPGPTSHRHPNSTH